MKRCTFWIAWGLLGCLACEASAQTTSTTTPSTTTTSSRSSGSTGIGTGGGIGLDANTGVSFTGGSGGQGMTSSGSFTGGSSFVGGSTGTPGGGGGRASSSSSTTPSQYNPFRATYKTYSASGAGLTKTFGQPQFATLTTSQAGGQAGGFNRGGGFAGGFGGSSTAGLQGAGAQSTGFSTVGTRRAPSYTTTLGRGVQIVTPPPMTLVGELRTALSNADGISSKQGIQVTMEGGAVVLRGRVEDESERRLVERMMRLTPGVREIRNELTAP